MKRAETGVTLMELLIAMTLLGLLSVGIVTSLRVGLSAMTKTDTRLMSNRRAASVERVLEQDVDGIMPVTADCLPLGGGPPTRISFFQGETASMRFVSSYSVQQGARGLPMILEFQVIPGEDNQGVRLVVNEHVYTGTRGVGLFCLGTAKDPETGVTAPRFPPIAIGANSFVLADKLAYCRFSFRDIALPQQKPIEFPNWVVRWFKPVLPSAIRIEMAPLTPDSAKLQPVTLTIPLRVTRWPMRPYEN